VGLLKLAKAAQCNNVGWLNPGVLLTSTLSHLKRAARCLGEAGPIVPEGRLRGFWHYWLPGGLGILKFRLQKRRQYVDRSVLFR
jgi:hypothetical protein